MEPHRFMLSFDDRKQALRAWLAGHGVALKELALAMDVTPAMVTRIVHGDFAPRERIEQMQDLGIPVELLPSPSCPKGKYPRNKG